MKYRKVIKLIEEELKFFENNSVLKQLTLSDGSIFSMENETFK